MGKWLSAVEDMGMRSALVLSDFAPAAAAMGEIRSLRHGTLSRPLIKAATYGHPCRVDFSRFAFQHQPQSTSERVISTLRNQKERAGFSDLSFTTSEFIRLKMLEKLVAAGDLTSDLRWKTRTQSFVTV